MFTKRELISRVAEKTKLTKKKTQETIDLIIETIKSELKSGNRVKLPGMGYFELVTKNVKENGVLKPAKPGRMIPKFRFTKSLRELVASAKIKRKGKS